MASTKGKYFKESDCLKGFIFNKKLLDEISGFIQKHENFVLTTHIGSDPDGLASEISLYFFLKKLKKNVIIINNEPVPENYEFMAPNQIVKNTETGLHEIEKMDFTGYVLISLDNSETNRLGKIKEFCDRFKCSLATIDHHIVKKQKYFFVDDSYAATSEIIWELYKYTNTPLNRQIAISLYAGIIADTGNFRFSKTSVRTHLAGGDLLDYGFSPDDVYRKIFESSPPDRLKLFKKILDKAIINTEKKYIAAFVKKSMFRKLKLGDTPTEGIVNQLLAVKDIKISALMTETPDGHLKCSLRSIDDVNVAALAGKFGGGGHRNAAGLFVKGPFDDAARKIIIEIEKAVSV
ncbi:MAG: bifunctional oligoribonuclease/PAP phosphatase NrnA [Spirochaetia bacterium]|nr:bifunctional oligoribonuclease/PAP phosphatase NrnA [Spirochaetia bacterium]